MRGIRRPRLAVAGEHLVIGLAQLVIGIGRIHARARNPSRSGHDIGAAKVLGIRENLMLHDAKSCTEAGASRKHCF